MNDPVFQLQLDVAARLNAHPFFSDILVLANEKGLLGDDLENALKLFTAKSGKSGVAVVVDRPLRQVPKPDAPGPEMVIIVPVTVVEMPLLNRAASGTGKTTEQIVSEAMATLHGWRASSWMGQLYCAEDAVTPTVGGDKTIATEIQFRTRLRMATVPRTGTPVISGSAAAVQIGCNTPDASIYYTTDGSWPWSGNPSAVLFGITLLTEDGQIIVTEDGDPLNLAEPFSVAAGTHVRAAAYAANKQGSDGAAATLT
jgi:hypothetical protein